VPSTTFTRPGLAAVVLCAATATAATGGTQCFARDYGDDHLARNPAQVVRAMRVVVPGDPVREGIRLSATMADQGHVAGTDMAGRTIPQGLFCFGGAGPLRCGMDCDGGIATLEFRADGALHLTTDHLDIGDAETCGGTVSLVETPGTAVVYRLLPADQADCAGL